MRTKLLCIVVILITVSASTVLSQSLPAYRIDVALPKYVYRLGETLDALITLTNIVDNPIFLSDPFRGESVLSLGFEVRDRKSGELLKRWDLRQDGQEYQAGILKLDPGEQYELVDPVFWDGLVPPVLNFLPPGEYELLAYYSNQLTIVEQYETRVAIDFHTVVQSIPLPLRVEEPIPEERQALERFQNAWVPNRPIAERINSIAEALTGEPLPDNFRVRLLYHQANLEILRGEIDEAKRLLESAKRIDSFLNEAINLRLGELLLEQGDRDMAITHLRRCRLHRARFLLENESILGPTRK